MTKTSKQIEIPFSKAKLIAMLICSIIFVFIGLILAVKLPAINNEQFGSQTPMFWVGLVSIIFFGACCGLFIRKLVDKKPALIIDNIGVTDNSSGVSAGQILWSDITKIFIIEIHRQKLIMIEVKNPQDYISRQASSFKRKMMQISFNEHGTPLSISQNILQIKANDLHSILTDRLSEFNNPT